MSQPRVQGGHGERGYHDRKFDRGNRADRSERGSRSGNERGRGHDRRVSLSTGKVFLSQYNHSSFECCFRP